MKGHETVARSLPWEALFIAFCPDEGNGIAQHRIGRFSADPSGRVPTEI
jgi:hypothetical protein